MNLLLSPLLSPLDNVVIYAEKDEFDKVKAPPQKTVKR